MIRRPGERVVAEAGEMQVPPLRSAALRQNSGRDDETANAGDATP